MVQKAVRDLCEVGAKLTDDLGGEHLNVATKLVGEIVHPLGSDDIRALVSLLPEGGDTAHGLNWTILHAIEAAPDWPLWDTLENQHSDWVQILRRRLENGGFLPPTESA